MSGTAGRTATLHPACWQAAHLMTSVCKRGCVRLSFQLSFQLSPTCLSFHKKASMMSQLWDPSGLFPWPLYFVVTFFCLTLMSLVALRLCIHTNVCVCTRTCEKLPLHNYQRSGLLLIRPWKQTNQSILDCFDDIATSSRERLVPEQWRGTNMTGFKGQNLQQLTERSTEKAGREFRKQSLDWMCSVLR